MGIIDMEDTAESFYDLSAESELLELAQTGDQKAFGQIMKNYHPRLYQTALAMLNSPQEAEKAVKAAVDSAFVNLADYHGDSLFLTWICRHLMKHIIHHHSMNDDSENKN